MVCCSTVFSSSSSRTWPISSLSASRCISCTRCQVAEMLCSPWTTRLWESTSREAMSDSTPDCTRRTCCVRSSTSGFMGSMNCSTRYSTRASRSPISLSGLVSEPRRRAPPRRTRAWSLAYVAMDWLTWSTHTWRSARFRHRR